MFKGSIAALATPFTDDNRIDFKAFHQMIEWQIESGTDALVICGSTGEASTLSEEEQLQLFKEAVIAAKGKIPLIAGTGSNNTAHAIHLTKEAQKAGFDAALVILPYYNRPTAEGCFQHFQALSHLGFPLIIYNHPARTGIKLTVKALARLSTLPNVVGIKEGSCDLDFLIELMHETESPIFSGDDTLALPFMACGAKGVISIVANIIPRQWKILTTLLLVDQLDEGREFFHRYFPLAKSMVLEINPQCVKFALSALGKCSSRMRLPLIEPSETTKQTILEELCKAELMVTV